MRDRNVDFAIAVEVRGNERPGARRTRFVRYRGLKAPIAVPQQNADAAEPRWTSSAELRMAHYQVWFVIAIRVDDHERGRIKASSLVDGRRLKCAVASV